ncbi:hypothetical protein SISSUDRAFT_987463 [Sistotremastrum suecicum HHB10207 ss-3]|uniref:Uncharacterized protein n=1 Tax=Sistotremastrum suecicum HHB10207 ss-3 TaxID=1314776 RepID=A0A166CNY2_9AGAM|nr:hypothetical protein SISSUDRAFT_987463 [Sistotremastrum suecicum HHB10207 ss-3]
MPHPVPRQRVSSDPCLPLRLPSTSILVREGELSGPREVLRQLRRTPSPPVEEDTEGADEEGEEELPADLPQRPRTLSSSTSRSSSSITSMFKRSPKVAKPWREPAPFELFRAIEDKDLMYIMEVRDRAFHLLLRKTGEATPLVHAMRIGASHRDVAMVLIGAMSRWVNHLEDHDMEQPRTRVILKALRTNLKLAIDYGLQRSQSDLIPSFLQTLIMSEGDRWVTSATASIALALRAGTEGKPVAAAESLVRKFATKELGKADGIAALDDYISNATIDLLLFGVWSIALESIPNAESMPVSDTYYFARDDRVWRAFKERLDTHQNEIGTKLSKRLRWQIRVLCKVLENRSETLHRKMDLLSGELDDGPGV